jgi:hypothetical protein
LWFRFDARQLPASLFQLPPRITREEPRDRSSELPAPWRGVFATAHPRETLFTQDLAVPPSQLLPREPNVILNPRWLDDEGSELWRKVTAVGGVLPVAHFGKCAA